MSRNFQENVMSESPLELYILSGYIQSGGSSRSLIAMVMMIKIFSVDYPRPIEQFEKEYLLRGLVMLDEAKPIPIPGEDGTGAVAWIYKEELVMQIDSLVVIGRCQCGDPNCHTVQFQHHRGGHSEKIVELALDDGRTLSIYVDRERGLLSQLEVIKE